MRLSPPRMISLFLAAAALQIAVGPAAGALATVRVASGLNRPIFVTAPAGDDRLFIIEQRGVIRILSNGQLLPTPFLDIDALVPGISGNDERGLLGLAFHPDYDANGRFYLDYTNLLGDTVIAEYLVSTDPDVADPGSERILLTIDQPYANHNGGTIRFGPLDGYLYIGMGDGGSAGDPENRAQNDGSLLGKMLRIDVDGPPPYGIPPGNPFVGPGLPLDEIWSKGWRNPYRWSFDPATGDLWAADVGQSSWEEIDFEAGGGAGGGNYGWRLMEGTHCYDPPSDCNNGTLILPIHEYSHGGTPFRCSVTGGAVYRGTAIPSLVGAYLFADFCSGQIWSLRYDGSVVHDLQERTAELAPGSGLSIGSIADIGADGHGELYIVDRGSGSDGEIYKIGLAPAGAPQGEVETGRLLSPARPNPFTRQTLFPVHVSEPGVVRIEVFDAAGRKIKGLADEILPAGTYAIRWDGRDEGGGEVSTGVYFVRGTVGDGLSSTRVQRIR